jgi:hypothetical protein
MYLFIWEVSWSVLLSLIKIWHFVVFFCVNLKLCSGQKILYFANAQLLWECLMMPVWLNSNTNNKKKHIKWQRNFLCQINYGYLPLQYYEDWYNKIGKIDKIQQKTRVIYLVLQYYLSIHFLMTVLTFRY